MIAMLPSPFSLSCTQKKKQKGDNSKVVVAFFAELHSKKKKR